MSHSVVIGGAGFVGSWVVEEILKDPDNEVTIVDNLISSEKWNISNSSRVKFIQGSASDLETLAGIGRDVDFVYQLACFHGNQSSIARPLDDFENGLKSTLVTLEWVKNFNKKARVVYSGAGCAVAEKTWGDPEAVKEKDSTSLQHDSPYSISKITGEMYCLYYAKQMNLDVVRVRFQNVYGPREILGAGVWRGTVNTIWRNVIPTFIYKALKNIDIEVFQGATASRDFVYVEDIARGVVLAAIHGERGAVYNLASGQETFIDNLAELILKQCNSESSILIKDRRTWDNSGRRLGDPANSELKLKFKTETKLEVGISKTIEWSRENLEKIDSCIAKFQNI